MPPRMAFAIAYDCAALPTDLSTLADADLCHGGTSNSCDLFDAGMPAEPSKRGRGPPAEGGLEEEWRKL
jgi:hypothetical protein